MRKRKILVFSNLQNSVTRMLQQRKKVIFSPLENRKNKKEKQNMGTQQQSISSRKKWDIQRGKTAPRKWELPENRSKSRKWGLPDPTAVFMATFRENAKVEHDCQTPENRDSSVTKVMEDKPVKRREIRPNEPTAFCHNCQEMTPMVWLPKEKRGKNCDTWFKCEFCGGRNLTIKYITEKEAIAKNKLAKEAEDL